MSEGFEKNPTSPIAGMENISETLPATFEGGFDPVPLSTIEEDLAGNPEILARIFAAQQEDAA